MTQQITKSAGGVGLTEEEYELAKKHILNDAIFDDDNWSTFKLTPGGRVFSYEQYQLMRDYFLSTYGDDAKKVKQDQKDLRLWEYLRKKLKPLDDNNVTANRIFNYIKQNYTT